MSAERRGKDKESFMKKVLIFFVLILILMPVAFAEEGRADSSQKAAIGLGAEWNMNSRDNFAMGAVLAFDYNLGSAFALGINATASSNFNGIFVIEPAGFFRWYFLGKGHTGLFVQADAGAYLVLEDDDITPLFLGGVRAGLRLPLGEKFFVEPFGRVGYPFAFGVGCLAGIRF